MTENLNAYFAAIIAQELSASTSSSARVNPQQVLNTIALLDEGATVPFIARYRKEVTGNLDDQQLRVLDERLGYLRELEERRKTIVKSIEEQGKMTDELRSAVMAATTKQALEDIYLPYKPKRRTKAQIAIEAGLLPLADALFQTPTLNPEEAALAFVDAEKGVTDVKAALDGARDILAERFYETPELLAKLRDKLWDVGVVTTQVLDASKDEGEKFRDYYEYVEPIKHIPAHRALAIFRARKEGVLSSTLDWPDVEVPTNHPALAMIAGYFNLIDQKRAADAWLQNVCRWSWRVKIHPHIEQDLLSQLKETAETDAIHVFARNLHELLLAAPAGKQVVMGLDPGIRTGVKVAVVDSTGKVIATETIYPFQPMNQYDKSVNVLAALCMKHHVTLISIGNGTASRETEKMAADVIKLLKNQEIKKIVVSEAGASVYSASPLAAAELPELDVTLRGAVSIARRLQDPLAELVKIEPKAIGVGQYQHDVNQRQLAKSLEAVVEDCVNKVGVDLNTASPALLSHISGLNQTLAEAVVKFRDANGRFNTREMLLKVPRLGPKAYEQAAGFLRIPDGDNPLDASSVHPEAYGIVEKMVSEIKVPVQEMIGNKTLINQIKPSEFVTEQFGLLTIRDILQELEKPGRDPRATFVTVEFNDEINEIKDLKPGMMLDGVVTNVTAFGAFVDIGVHQDGLVHISEMADRFIKDAHEVVRPGQIVKVRVMEVDVGRKRIGLSMKTESRPVTKDGHRDNNTVSAKRGSISTKTAGKGANQNNTLAGASSGALGGALAEAFAKAKR